MRAAGDLGRGTGGISAGESISGTRDQVLEDLRRPELAGFLELRIQDPKRLHSSVAPQQDHQLPHPGTGAVSSLTDRDALEAVEVGHITCPFLRIAHLQSHPVQLSACGTDWEGYVRVIFPSSVQSLLDGGGHAQTMSSQAAYAVLVELCQNSSTASAGLHTVAARGKGAEQSLVPRMQARPCVMYAITAPLLTSSIS